MDPSYYVEYDTTKPAREILEGLALRYSVDITWLNDSAITKEEMKAIQRAEIAAMRRDVEYQDSDMKTFYLDGVKEKYAELLSSLRLAIDATFRDVWTKAAIEKLYVDLYYEKADGATYMYHVKPIRWTVRPTGDLAGGVKVNGRQGYRNFSAFGMITISFGTEHFLDEYTVPTDMNDYYIAQKLADIVVVIDDISIGDDIGGTNISTPAYDELPFTYNPGATNFALDPGRYAMSPEDDVLISSWGDLYREAHKYFLMFIERFWNAGNLDRLKSNWVYPYERYIELANMMPQEVRNNYEGIYGYIYPLQYSIDGFMTAVTTHLYVTQEWKWITFSPNVCAILAYYDSRWDVTKVQNYDYRVQMAEDKNWSRFHDAIDNAMFPVLYFLETGIETKFLHAKSKLP